MKRNDNFGQGEPPVGFEQVRLDSTTALLLPQMVAVDFKGELRRRENEAEEVHREGIRKRQAELQEAAKAQKQASDPNLKSSRKAFGAKPRQGWYRVLPKLADIEKEVDGRKAIGGFSDKDVTERLRSVREKLLNLGPDRRIAVPRNWRDEVDRLEAMLPHFRGPIGSVRNALALAEVTGRPVRIPPMLLLGGPGVGKTRFSHELARLLGTPHGSIAFDQPSYGGQLRGTDSAWGNTQTGLLFNLICLDERADPVILLDELDKACTGSTRFDVDPTAQLHGALEPESARRILDISVHVEFDASMTTYIATANSVRGVGAPLLSRFEVFVIEQPRPVDSVELARSIAESSVQRLGLEGRVSFERQAVYLLAHLSPRKVTRAVDASLAAAVLDGRDVVREDDVWAVLRVGDRGPLLH